MKNRITQAQVFEIAREHSGFSLSAEKLESFCNSVIEFYVAQKSVRYSIDEDEDGIRARVSDAICGAMNFGAQGVNQPPDGHWLTPFWNLGAAQAAPKPLVDEQVLWLWNNGDHYLAFDNLYPCFTQGGDPMTLGEPAARAIFITSFGRNAQKETDR